ncbi:MAG: hypothetical protein OEM15_01830 [Myxococcales bacterium]|nr:hypothetical protein [Myxococcales bacterium]MDH3482647.1 hypothetical protein [Myxococcales bacterium]
MQDLLRNGPKESRLFLVLAHGAGAPMDTPFMNAIAEAVAEAGISVVRFEFEYMSKRRQDGRRRGPDRAPELIERYQEVLAQVGDPRRTIIGGKSMGGRIASMIADDAGVAGLVCLGYPFHPPGKPERLRTAHLETLRTPALIAQGTRDPFGTPKEVASYALSPSIEVVWIKDGDHSFKPRKKSGRTNEQNLATAADAIIAFANSLR